MSDTYRMSMKTVPAPMPANRRADAKARTRAKLLRAATQVFAKRGFNQATVEEIAERAGFTRGAFYANFADKADALLTLLEEQRHKDMDEIARLVASTPDEEKIPTMQDWYLRLLGDQRLAQAIAELTAQPSLATAVRRRLARRQASMRSSIADMLRAYRERAGVALPLDDEQIASFILAIGDGIAAQRHLEPTVVHDDAFTTAVAYLWFGLRSERS